MLINGKRIAETLEKKLRKEVITLKKNGKLLKLVTILVGKSSEQISFVKIKQKYATKLGVKFEFVHLKTTPTFEKFIHIIKQKSLEKETTGMIIQQPLPSQLSTDCIYDFVDIKKEIEGHKKKSSFLPPIGLAILTVCKYIYLHPKIDGELFVDLKKDTNAFKKALKHKKVVLIGCGITGGQPIGKTLNNVKINYVGINSTTPNSNDYYRTADLIITAVGKKVISQDFLKKGTVLINVGLRKERNKLLGDYDEKEIKSVASYYTPTPGGIGPLDVLYLYKNLIDAAKLQN